MCFDLNGICREEGRVAGVVKRLDDGSLARSVAQPSEAQLWMSLPTKHVVEQRFKSFWTESETPASFKRKEAVTTCRIPTFWICSTHAYTHQPSCSIYFTHQRDPTKFEPLPLKEKKNPVENGSEPFEVHSINGLVTCNTHFDFPWVTDPLWHLGQTWAPEPGSCLILVGQPKITGRQKKKSWRKVEKEWNVGWVNESDPMAHDTYHAWV